MEYVCQGSEMWSCLFSKQKSYCIWVLEYLEIAVGQSFWLQNNYLKARVPVFINIHVNPEKVFAPKIVCRQHRVIGIIGQFPQETENNTNMGPLTANSGLDFWAGYQPLQLSHGKLFHYSYLAHVKKSRLLVFYLQERASCAQVLPISLLKLFL